MSAPVPIDLSAAEAREKVDTVKALVSDAWTEVADLYRGRAWLALGYTSWDALCDAEFEGARIRLPREERQAVVGSLREAGLSIRAIAAATGADKDTVLNDLSGIRTPDPAPVTGTDGKSYSPIQPPRPAPALADQRTEPAPPGPAPSPPMPPTPTPAPADQNDPEPVGGEEPAGRSRRSRTDVVGQIEQVLMHARRAVQAAEPLERSHFTSRKDEAARWADGLGTHVQALQRLLDTISEASQ